MKIKSLTMLAVSAFTGALFAAEIPLPSTELNFYPKQKDVNDSSIVLKERVQVRSKKLFKIDPTKTYSISGSIKSVKDATDNRFFMGYIYYDANKKVINFANVSAQDETFTSLAAAVDAKDTVLKVKDASNWKNLRLRTIAFNAKADKSDLPNRTVSPIKITKVEKTGDVWSVTLEKPIGKSYAAGTNIRLHRYSGWDYVCNYVKNSVGLNGATKAKKIGWPGAEYYQIVILANWVKINQGEAPALEIKDLKVIEQ